MSAARDATAAVAAALAATVDGVLVHDGDPDKLAAGRQQIVVDATGVEWTLHRDAVSITADCWAPAGRPARGDRAVTGLVADTVAALAAWQPAGDAAVYRPRTSELTGLVDDEPRAIDGSNWATGSVELTVAVEHPDTDVTYGVSAQRVVSLLAAADGLPPVVPSADRGEFCVVRGMGAWAENPVYDVVDVWVCAPADTGRADTLARRVWDSLYRSDQVIAQTYQLELGGVAPGCRWDHDVAQIALLALRGSTADDGGE